MNTREMLPETFWGKAYEKFERWRRNHNPYQTYVFKYWLDKLHENS